MEEDENACVLFGNLPWQVTQMALWSYLVKWEEKKEARSILEGARAERVVM